MATQKLYLYLRSDRTETSDAVAFDVDVTDRDGELRSAEKVWVDDNEPLDVWGPIISRAVDEGLAEVGLYSQETGWHYDPETTTYDVSPIDSEQYIVTLEVK